MKNFQQSSSVRNSLTADSSNVDFIFCTRSGDAVVTAPVVLPSTDSLLSAWTFSRHWVY